RACSPLQRIPQCAQQLAAVAAPRAAVHTRERRRLETRQPLEMPAAVARVRVVVERPAEGLARPEDVGLGQRWQPVAALGEEIAAEQRARRALPEKSALPGVRDVRRVEPRHAMPPERERLAVAERARRAIGRSVIETSAATWPQAGAAWGAAASH